MDNPKPYCLEDICGKTHVLNPTPQESEDLSEPEEKKISWIAAVIAFGPGVFLIGSKRLTSGGRKAKK